MTALGKVVRAGVGRRRVQSLVMVLTTLIAVTASVLAVGLLVASQEPFDRAFAKQQGAHLTAQADGSKASAAQLKATADTDGVAAAAGPYAVTSLRLSGEEEPPPGFRPPPLLVAGRASADDAVDDLSLSEGRWATGPGEIVIEQDSVLPWTQVGSTPNVSGLPGEPALTVVGIAESVGESADAWVTPEQLKELSAPDAKPAYQMLYRFEEAGTRAELTAGREAIAAALPADALSGTQSYLDVKQRADADTAAFIPFVTAFALLGLAMSVLVISIVVSGAVSSASRRIGILKSLGFTPPQVGRAFVAQALIPSAIGAVLGAVLGNLLAVPMMSQVGEAYGTGVMLPPLWVDLAVPAFALALVAATALGPALRAARLRTAEVISLGRTPHAGRGRRIRHLLGRLPLPRPLSLGLANPFAHPARSATMAGAVTFGALAVTFAVGLGSSLISIQTDGDTERAGDATVLTNVMEGPPKSSGEAVPTEPAEPPEPADPAAVAAAIRSQSGTGAYFGTAKLEVSVAGLKGGAPLVAYEGDTSFSKYKMTSGRWFTAPGEAVAASRFLQATGKEVGDTVTLTDQGRTARLKIVGEVFDLRDDGMAIRTGTASVAKLSPGLAPSEFYVDIKAGTDTAGYVEELNEELLPLHSSAAATELGHSTTIQVMQALIAMLTAMLVAVACLGVLNTVVLDTRERIHDLGVFKALGMSPRQTVAMVLTSVSGIGLVAGAIGVPLGVALHHYVMPAMGDSVGTNIPASSIEVYDAGLLALLALGGVAIAAVGALLPAGWAAKTGTAASLRTE